MRRLLATACLAAATFACVSPGVPSPQPTQLPLLARVQAGDEVIGVVQDGSSLELFIVDSSGRAEMITRSHESGSKPSVHLSSYGGQTGLVYNTFVFGMAPDEATRFELNPPETGLGGEVFGGTFVVAMRQRDVMPDQLNWAFLRQDGSVVVEGSGIRG